MMEEHLLRRPSDSTESPGGQGDSVLDPHHKRACMVLLGQAIAQNWPVDVDIKRVGVKEMRDILENDPKVEMRMKAFDRLVQAERANLAREKNAIELAKLESPHELHQHVHIESETVNESRNLIASVIAQINDESSDTLPEASDHESVGRNGHGMRNGNGKPPRAG